MTFGQLRAAAVSLTAWISGLCIFVPAGLIFLMLSFFIHPKHFDRWIKAACRLIVRCLFIRVQVHGAQAVRRERTYLFMANHVNLFDVFVLYGHIPNAFRGVELDEHFDWFFYGRIIRRLGMIPISQTNARSALKSLRLAQEALCGGTSILILPEGGRTLDGAFQPFKRGAFLLAKSACVDIVPVVMSGAYAINRKGSLRIRPGTMTLRFGDPISSASIANVNSAQLEAHVRQKMLDLFEG